MKPAALLLIALIVLGIRGAAHAQLIIPAPVTSVNTKTGAVIVPNSIRGSCLITSFDSGGNGSCTFDPTKWTGGTAFTTLPDCSGSWTSGSGNYVYAAPIITNSQTAPSAVTQAALKILTISLGLATIWATPPAGSTLTVVCRGQ